MSVKHPSNTWVRRLYTIALIAMAAISVCYIGQVMWYMATSPNKMTVEVISSTAEPAVETNITTPPTEAVVGKLVASATNKEPSDITFSVRLRLADGETNKNK